MLMVYFGLSWGYILTQELHTGIPWTMCHGQHFNGSLLTCNGVGGSNDGCRKFTQSQLSAGLPALWTEDEQWYDRFGQAQVQYSRILYHSSLRIAT